MIKLIIFLVFSFALILLGMTLAQDPGVLIIAYGRTSIEMPLWFGIGVIFVTVFVLHVIFRTISVVMHVYVAIKAWFARVKARFSRKSAT